MKFPALSLALIILGCNSHAHAQNLTVALASNTDLSNFTTVLETYPELVGLTNITLLAPTNAAFSEFLNSSSAAALTTHPDLVQAILSYHILNGIYTNFTDVAFIPTLLQPGAYANVTGGQRVEALGGQASTIFSGLLQNATITSFINFTGGVIHIIDRFLTVPQNISSTTVAFNLTSAAGAASVLHLANVIDTTSDLTYFVPNNAAFQRIGGNLANLTVAELTPIMEYHVIQGFVGYTTDIMNGTVIPTLNGSNVTLSFIQNSVYVNNARVITPNVLVSNGVVHVIDRVLNPSNTTVAPNTATTEEAFPDATSATSEPFTGSVPTPTSAIPTEAATSAAAAAAAASSSASDSNSAPATKSHTGAIAGGVVGGIIGLALITALFWFLRKKRSSPKLEEKQRNTAIVGGGGVGRAATTKSYHKPELEAPNSPPGNPKTSSVPVPVPVMSEIDTPVSRTRTELTGTTAPQGALATQENQAPQQQQQPPHAQAQALVLAQQQEQERLREQETQEARIAELTNQRRIAEIEHQKRMAQLDHERRMAELDISAARIRSQNRTIAELEARANPGPGSGD